MKEKMPTEQKTNVKNSVGRLTVVGLSIIVQLGWLFIWLMRVNQYSVWLSAVTRVLALLIVLRIYGKHTNAAIKMPWIILILTVPIMGICCYFIVGQSRMTRKKRNQFARIDEVLFQKLPQDEQVFRRLEEKDIAIANQCRYLKDYSKYPVYQNTDVEFYDKAADGLEAQKEELKKARHFIFMEYHAIEIGEAFAALRDILVEKAGQGVEVRVFYDDVGSIGFLNPEFIKSMEADGIQCRVFNPVNAVWNLFMNNRDHRKITVIDGRVGFTGGYNLANEYFNITHPYGYWKDTGIKLTGDAVRSMTVMFLEMWNTMKMTDTDYDRYLPKVEYRALQHGYVQPYADSPLDAEHVGENVYLNLIKNAKHYIYFTTPYLIITDEMARELGLAAKRGVDVRIITPGIPDKKVIFQLTRSYYAGLVRRGVRIYEFTPGFCHAKQCVADGEVATVGTINLDYRSLYLHFENGTLLYDCEAVQKVRQDFDATLPLCQEVTDKYRSGRSVPLRMGQCILRLFSPLL